MKDTKFIHPLCNLHASDQVCCCLYFTLDFVHEAAIFEQYGNVMALAVYKLLDIFDPDYRQSTWIGGEE